MSSTYTIVGLGELLWDLLPDGRQLGGAPANFAYFTNLLGDRGVVASRVGDDDLGHAAAGRLRELGSSPEHLQFDSSHPTGTVQVRLDAAGQPEFEIARPVAWDFLQWTPAWKLLAEEADAVCFGSLAQRSPVSRETILQFVRSTRRQALRVFDVNLRAPFYSAEVLAASLALADIVKLNNDELPVVARLLGIPFTGERAAAEALLRAYKASLVCVTRGNCGSLLMSRQAAAEHPGYRVEVADTVGAGDAFTATLVHHCLRGASLEEMNEAANRVGAWVASQVGATPVPQNGDLQLALAA
ncbi:MAG TPA: carbohydrate kinase, partial [Terriglobales bacterium]|nr:carbohydrate kinase [Terriglobales bacterium]